MPVPVPRFSKPVAHPVVKPPRFADENLDSSASLLASPFSVSLARPPPSFGTREQWINSLPQWRRAKPRRIWEDELRGDLPPISEPPFHRGLTVEDNAPVIKGTRAEACTPPLPSLLQTHDSFGPSKTQTRVTLTAFDHQESTMHVKQLSLPQSSDKASTKLESLPIFSCPPQAFSPTFEDQSPQDDSSSPLEPVTPFAEFVDRAVATSLDGLSSPNSGQDPRYPYTVSHGALAFHALPPSFPTLSKEPTLPSVAISEVATPSASLGYRKLAEPLSEWVANYVWKVCTTGYSLPPVFTQTNAHAQYSVAPPNHLAGSIHSLLLSTLLQPSAVFLGIWYIVHLPVHFNESVLGPEHPREQLFKTALLQDAIGGIQLESIPFRLVVLGCMLANKWLDDHTFSNKTWHSISNIPIHALNKLESLALDIFAYDISVLPQKWSRWLTHLLSYHLSLSSPGHPQPISRPSTNPHSIIRKVLEEIIDAPKSGNSDASTLQPVFLGLGARKQEKADQERALEALDINLDENGPLREEYIPKRRTSRAGSVQSTVDAFVVSNTQPLTSTIYAGTDPEKVLPPPAKWSPAGDEPILRESNRVSGHYVAVQPPLAPVAPLAQYPLYQHPAFSQVQDYQPSQPWGPNPAYHGLNQFAYPLDIPAFYDVSQAVYAPFQFGLPCALSHSRSHSLAHDQDNSRNHSRSYSQAPYEYRCSNVRMAVDDPAPPLEHTWAPPSGLSGHYAFPAHAFTANPAVTCQSTWLRT